MARFPDFTAAEVVTAAKLDSGMVDYILKTADESVTSSTTLQNDNHLAATIGATGTYAADLHLWITSAADAAGDIKVSFTFPTGTLHMSGDGLDTSLATGFGGTSTGLGVLSATSGTSTIAFGASTSTLCVRVHALLIATATGTLQLQWAQNGSNGNATTVKAGSHMIVRQVA